MMLMEETFGVVELLRQFRLRAHQEQDLQKEAKALTYLAILWNEAQCRILMLETPETVQ